MGEWVVEGPTQRADFVERFTTSSERAGSLIYPASKVALSTPRLLIFFWWNWRVSGFPDDFHMAGIFAKLVFDIC
jgi:hypothetical protein